VDHVRLSTWLPVQLLLGLFTGTEDLEPRPDDDHPGYVRFQWKGRRTASNHEGSMWLPDNRRDLIEFVTSMRRDPLMEPRVEVFLAVALERDGQERGWHLERVAEILHGRRDQLRSHRERHLPPLRMIQALFETAWFGVEAPVPEGRRDSNPRRPAMKAKRGDYGGGLTGSLLEVERVNRRTATLRLATSFAAGLGKGQYQLTPRDLLRVDGHEHRNPHGDRPTKAERARFRIAACHHTRARSANRAGRAVQALQLGEFLERWAGLARHRVDRLAARGRLPAYLDVLEEDLAAAREMGGPGLAVPVERTGPLSRCMLRLRSAGNPESAATASPTPLATASARTAGATPPRGRPSSHGP
jgi:hypothetical protein